jgi:small-conductance mechanosensitive channel
MRMKTFSSASRGTGYARNTLRGQVKPSSRSSAKTMMILLWLIFSLIGAGVSAGPQEAKAPPPDGASRETAPVILDDFLLFRVRGTKGFPAEERAGRILERIKKIADDPHIRTDSIEAVESEHSTDIMAEGREIVSVFDADASLEGIPRQVLAKAYVIKLREAIDAYRLDRSPKSIMRGLEYSLLATVLVIVVFFICVRLYRKVYSMLEGRYKTKISSLHIKTFEILHAETVWSILTYSLKSVRLILVLLIIYFYLHFVLRFFPWTRPFAAHLLDYVLMPVLDIGRSALEYIPNLIFIAILVVVVRYALKIIRLFFIGIERDNVKISGFMPEWSRPTYKLLRLFVIAFAAVIAYPYIPGSQSAAFKGISLFIGVLFSLGSSSAISNIIAGYMITYRRAFRIGDRVRINDFTGDITEMRLQVTHLRTIKNEEVIVPNSTVINSSVVNYSAFARDTGLILHTAVTIGYDAPWRQVHALLLMAAERTNHLLREPAPFVLQNSLDDFYVTYELNAYTDEPQMMVDIYSDLHKNIQDCFNEYGVQIMSPNYRADRAVPTIVPKEKWYAPPAAPPDDQEQ